MTWVSHFKRVNVSAHCMLWPVQLVTGSTITYMTFFYSVVLLFFAICFDHAYMHRYTHVHVGESWLHLTCSRPPCMLRRMRYSSVVVECLSQYTRKGHSKKKTRQDKQDQTSHANPQQKEKNIWKAQGKKARMEITSRVRRACTPAKTPSLDYSSKTIKIYTLKVATPLKPLAWYVREQATT